MYAYEVDSNKLTVFNRPDGFVDSGGNYIAPSTSFYDPDTSDIVSIGGIDWFLNEYKSVYTRMHLTQ
jgi:hypothetical protein